MVWKIIKVFVASSLKAPTFGASSREQLFLVDLEEKTGRSMVTGENFLPPGRKKISDK
jgi:hypothetical protein